MEPKTKIETEKQIIHADKVEIHCQTKFAGEQFWHGFFWMMGAVIFLCLFVAIADMVKKWF